MTAAGQVPHFHYCDEVHMANLLDLKAELDLDIHKKPDVKLTFMPFVLKACPKLH
jgi:2-oxoisovalerate dehydrogenase E2 component (dihydrolipoyl transacylase)